METLFRIAYIVVIGTALFAGGLWVGEQKAATPECPAPVVMIAPEQLLIDQIDAAIKMLRAEIDRMKGIDNGVCEPIFMEDFE